MPVRIAILGAGFMGSTHAKAIQSLDTNDIEIAAISGMSEARARPLADEIGVPWTTELDTLVADPTIDAVDICLPGPQHRAVTEAALAAGKHVLLEKPIALTMEDADALVALDGRTDRVFMIAHVLRFWPEYMEIQRRVGSGDYGKPISALAFRRQPFPAWSPLFGRSDLTGGAVLDMMIHDYDALNWLLGPPSSVACRGVANPRSGGGIDQIQAMIGYGGASAVVDGGMMMPESYPFTSALHVLCERGAFEYTFRAGGRSVEMGSGVNELVLYPSEGEPQTLSVEQANPYAAEIAYFVDCIKHGRRADRASPADARIALRLAHAARDSVASGAVVEIAPPR